MHGCERVRAGQGNREGLARLSVFGVGAARAQAAAEKAAAEKAAQRAVAQRKEAEAFLATKRRAAEQAEAACTTQQGVIPLPPSHDEQRCCNSGQRE